MVDIYPKCGLFSVSKSSIYLNVYLNLTATLWLCLS